MLIMSSLSQVFGIWITLIDVAYQYFPCVVDPCPQGSLVRIRPAVSSLVPRWRPPGVDASTVLGFLQ